MEHLICTQCGAEVRPEEAYHVGGEAVCPSCAETDTVACSYCGERIWREDDLVTVTLPCVNPAMTRITRIAAIATV